MVKIEYTMNIIEKLQDPELVAQFQKYFGVINLHDNSDPNQTISTDINGESGTENGGECSSLRQREIKVCKKPGVRCSNEKNITNDSKWSSVLLTDGTVGGREGIENSSDTSETNISTKEQSYIITNKFWFYLFYIATKTGDEIFYIIFFPFWKWNIDGAVIRKVIYIWMITMYIGQALKDILKVPRPHCPPVVRLDNKWELEYGLPSTHAMVAFSIPFSILTLSLSRYQLNFTLCFAIALIWCILVCTSRIYLGMHSVLDIVSGLLLISGLLNVTLSVIEAWDLFMIRHPFSPLISITLSIAMIVCYPASDRWTPARGDTTVIVGVGCGCLVGSWLNYQMGIISEPNFQRPFAVIWPTVTMMGLSLLRTLLGLIILIAVRVLFKSLSFTVICAFLQVSADDYKKQPSKIPQRHRLVVELFYKFITYMTIGFTIVFTAPVVFKAIGIERPTFYTEV